MGGNANAGGGNCPGVVVVAVPGCCGWSPGDVGGCWGGCGGGGGNAPKGMFIKPGAIQIKSNDIKKCK